MGDQISCCDAKTQLDNASNGFNKISTGNTPISNKQLTKLNFSPMSNQIKSIIEKAQKSKYFKGKNFINEGRIKQTIIFGHDKSAALYQGEVLNGVADGYGTVTFPNGSFFQGNFSKGQPINGIFAFKQNCYFVGDIQKFQASGLGIYENIDNGYYYEGQWKKNLQHGNGMQKYSNKDQYQGGFMCGSKFGEGQYKFANGKHYKGSFYNGLSDGHGQLTLPNGDSYSGEWRLGQMHGLGSYKWKNGQKYVGQYVNGVRQNKGKYYFSSGACYDGNWINGLQDGQGIIIQGYDQVKGKWQAGQKVD